MKTGPRRRAYLQRLRTSPAAATSRPPSGLMWPFVGAGLLVIVLGAVILLAVILDELRKRYLQKT